jgi:hypothetical protein
MRIERTVRLVAEPATVFEWVEDLDRYPQWMDLVHHVVAVADDGGRRAWDVELRANVGPFARSKRLRMRRSVHEPDRRVVFERAEVDGRSHSSWVLESTLRPTIDAVELMMTLTYGGNLWTGAVLERVLDDHVERGASALAALVEPSP